MNRRDFIKYSVTGIVGGSTVGCSAFSDKVFSRPGTTKKPNIVLFLVDDMGWQDCSEPFHEERTRNNRLYETPNFEKLSDEGMKFTNAYAHCVCSPSRVSLMTGMNPARHKVSCWTLYKNTWNASSHPTLEIPRWNCNGLSPTAGTPYTVHAKMLPQYLRETGYHTIHVGKAHFGAIGTAGEDPLNCGFDANIAGHAAGGPGSYNGIHDFSAVWRNGSAVWDIPGLKPYHGQDIFLTEALTLEACKELDKADSTGKPFYLYLSHYAIHAPIEKDDRYYRKYVDKGLSDNLAQFAAMIEGMDKSLGDVRAKIKELGQEDNTIYLFMSDNGGWYGTNAPLRKIKAYPYEGGTRVPLVVKWPGVTRAGSIAKEPVIIDDLFPTILGMAGVRDHSHNQSKNDSVSWLPLLKQTAGYPEERALFWHFPVNQRSDVGPNSTIRKGPWKLIYFYQDQHYQLYNLEQDISESTNLAKQKPDVVRRLAKLLGDYLTETGAQTPTFKSNGKPVPLPGREQPDTLGKL